MINCSLGDDNLPSPGETCTVICNISYELIGNGTRTCENDGSWSDSDVMCSRGEQLLTYVYLATLHLTRLLCDEQWIYVCCDVQCEILYIAYYYYCTPHLSQYGNYSSSPVCMIVELPITTKPFIRKHFISSFSWATYMAVRYSP